MKLPFWKIKKCFLCGSGNEVEEHHINWNHKDNRANNRILVCKKCHVVLHQGGYLSRGELEVIKATVLSLRSKYP